MLEANNDTDFLQMRTRAMTTVAYDKSIMLASLEDDQGIAENSDEDNAKDSN